MIDSFRALPNCFLFDVDAPYICYFYINSVCVVAYGTLLDFHYPFTDNVTGTCC